MGGEHGQKKDFTSEFNYEKELIYSLAEYCAISQEKAYQNPKYSYLQEQK